MSIGSSTEYSLKLALELLYKIIEVEKTVEINIPCIDKQRYNHGYYREMIYDEVESEYKNENGRLYLTDLKRKDKSGFYYVDKPFPISKEYKFIKSSNEGDIYEWDDIGFLCGSRGLLIVKDGMVIKQKMTAIA